MGTDEILHISASGLSYFSHGTDHTHIVKKSSLVPMTYLYPLFPGTSFPSWSNILGPVFWREYHVTSGPNTHLLSLRSHSPTSLPPSPPSLTSLPHLPPSPPSLTHLPHLPHLPSPPHNLVPLVLGFSLPSVSSLSAVY